MICHKIKVESEFLAKLIKYIPKEARVTGGLNYLDIRPSIILQQQIIKDSNSLLVETCLLVFYSNIDKAEFQKLMD